MKCSGSQLAWLAGEVLTEEEIREYYGYDAMRTLAEWDDLRRNTVIFEGENFARFMGHNQRCTSRLYPFPSIDQVEWTRTFGTVAPPALHFLPECEPFAMEAA